MGKIRVAVIGAGYFGSFHAEKYARIATADLVAVVDCDMKRAKTIARRYKTEAIADYKDLIGQVDAVSIVVPTTGHYEVAKAFLDSGTDVLVEKPIAKTLAQADQLISLANANERILQVGHLQRFSSAMLALEGLVTRPVFIECHRIAPFKPRGTEVNVIFDLMIHDIDLIQAIVGSTVVKVDAVGTPVLTKEADIASVRIHFSNGCGANVTASRVSLKSERKMRIFQTDTYLSIDFIQCIVTVLRKNSSEMSPGIPRISREERKFAEDDDLERELSSFINAVVTRSPPRVSGEDGRRALEIAFMINESLAAHSQRVRVAVESLAKTRA